MLEFKNKNALTSQACIEIQIDYTRRADKEKPRLREHYNSDIIRYTGICQTTGTRE